MNKTLPQLDRLQDLTVTAGSRGGGMGEMITCTLECIRLLIKPVFSSCI